MSESMTYIAKKSCGCVVAAAVDDPKHHDDVAKLVASCIRDGYVIERVTTEECRLAKWACHCDELPL